MESSYSKSRQQNIRHATLVCLSMAALTPLEDESSKTQATILDELRAPKQPLAEQAEEISESMQLSLGECTFPAKPLERIHSVSETDRNNAYSPSTSDLAEVQLPTLYSRLMKASLGIVGLTLGGLGYINYFTRSVPPEKRSHHMLSRLGEKMFPNEPFFPGNKISLRIFTLNHGVLFGAGLYAGLQSGQSMLSMSASLAAPAIFALGSALSYGVSQLYGQKQEVGTLLKGCEIVAWGSLVPMVASRFEAGAAFFEQLGMNGVMVGIGAGLLARTLSIAPMMHDYIKAAQKADPESFPPLRNQVFWLGATATGVAAVGFPLGIASIVPIGYFLQNAALISTGLVSKAYWRSQINKER